MNRLTYMEIAGKNYPLSFSLGACKAIAKKFGSIEKMGEALEDIEGINEGTIDDITYILSVLIAQGCAYKNIFEKDFPIEENAPVEDGKYIPLSPEELEIGVGLMGTSEIIAAISGCMNKSKETEIEAKPVEKRKNVIVPKEN